MVCVLLSLPATAAAEWFDDYERGVEALARGKPEQAVQFLEKAIRKRPEPGSNLITYGTNRLEEDFPYLKLAEAHLDSGHLDAAGAALERSNASGKEPADARARLEARWRDAVRADEARHRKVAPPPSPSPVPLEPPKPTTTVAPVPARPARPAREKTGTLVVRSEPESGASVLANGRFLGLTPLRVELDAGVYEITVRKEGIPAEHVSVQVKRGETNVVNIRLVEPPPAPRPERRLPKPPPKPVLEPPSLLVVSDPPGTSVYLDDELIGSTDPETGRLMKSGVVVGSHRIRLSRAGYAEIVGDIEIEPGGETLYTGTLSEVIPEVATPVEATPRAVDAPAAPEEIAEMSGRDWLVASMAFSLAALLLVVRRWRRALDQNLLTLTAGAPVERPRGTELAPTQTKVAEDTTEGSRFGEFRLIKRLGRGGMAVVYLAERNGERCALKKPLRALLGDDEFRERFLREADIGRTLHHPNIIRIFGRGEVNGVPYFTMELVEGGTLREKLRNRELSEPRDAAAIVLQIAEALDYAHLKGVVHRDLKPSNIMILDSGTVKVMDYGIARAQRFEGLTATGAFLGTPNYVAPETAEGKSTDARGDLYSLGIIFYEMMTGQRPFDADNPLVTLKKHCSEPPTPPSLIAPTVPRRLEGIILKLLAKSPDDRYPDAEHLLVDLRDFSNKAP